MSERSPELLSAERLAGARLPLERASTLPAEAFTAPAVYERERERLFVREWLCAGRADQLAARGDYFALDLLGAKLVVVRGTDDRIRVLSRVCRHRAAELVSDAGNAHAFQCPYHAWSYGLDGRLIGAPHMEGAEGFDREACRLPEVRSELWEGWIFVNFDADAPPLGPALAPLAKQLESYRMSEMVAIETASFESPFNWKVLVDNFMEAYHHIAIHRDTLEPIFPAARSHVSDNEGPYSLLFMPEREGSETGALPQLDSLSPEEAGQLVAGVIFPFHLFAPSGTGLIWYQLLPRSYDHFTLRIFNCFPQHVLDDPSHRDAIQGFQEITKLIHRQDIAACEATFAGLGSGSFVTGRLSPLEKSIWQFNQWWIERMTGPA